MAFGDFAIAPSTTVTLCAGVPLSKGSEDTFYFGSAGAQASKIRSYAIAGATFTECTYQRNQRDTIRLGMPMGTSGANSALRANYCIFNNTAFEGKPIYAFVDSVDYVNNNTIDVRFTIDAMQTFMFDYELKQCYVEREHSDTDQIGDNLVPEDFGKLDTVVNAVDETFIFPGSHAGAILPQPKYKTIVYYKDGDPQAPLSGSMINNVYCAADTYVGTNAIQLNGQIQTIQDTGGTIYAIIAVPPQFVDAGNNGWYSSGSVSINTSFVDGINTYTPKNAKMFTYPYNYLKVSNNAGVEKEYRWERFTAIGTAGFNVYGGIQPSPECALVPMDYEGVPTNYGEMCFFNNFPSSIWSEDSFAAWQTRNSNQYAASSTNNAISGATNIFSSALAGAAVGSMAGGIGAIPGAIVGAASSAVSTMNSARSLTAQAKDAFAAPDKFAGNASASVVNEVIGCTGFTIYKMNLPFDLAASVDDFFTMYGYATKRVKTPNRNVRPCWTYTKTQGCTIYGSIPAEYAREIQERYNNGVRFWNPSATVGDYSQDNSV